MEYQIKTITDVAIEPITLSMQKAWSQIDDDYSMNDAELLIRISAAREFIEREINIGCGVRTLELQWYGNRIELPFSPTVAILSVKQGDTTLADTDYSTDGFNAKSISINGNEGAHGNWFYSTIYGGAEYTPNVAEHSNTVYSVTYTTGYETLPNGLKNALLEQCDWMIKNQGLPEVPEISPSALKYASQYSRNLTI